MKNLRKSLLLIFALVAFGQTAWAQTNVSTESELTSAITNEANIRLTSDITLSEYLKIGQSSAQTVTTYGLKRNEYASRFDRTVTMEDLFQK